VRERGVRAGMGAAADGGAATAADGGEAGRFLFCGFFLRNSFVDWVAYSRGWRGRRRGSGRATGGRFTRDEKMVYQIFVSTLLFLVVYK
jgi:hypothetical protein